MSEDLARLLMRCDEFESTARLRALFAVDDLRPWQGGIPEADSVRSRVDLTIAYLGGQHHADGRPALGILCAILAQRYDPADERADALARERLRLNSAQQQGPSTSASPAEGKPRSKALIVPHIGALETHCVFAQSVTIGRAPSCDFALPRASSQVSNWHARIVYLPNNSYTVQDLGSSNGTFVDGQPITRATQLRPGATLQLSQRLSLRFEHYRDDPTAAGALVYRAPDGKELARYVIAPKGWAWFGGGPHQALRLPFTPPAAAPGGLCAQQDTIAFVRGPNDPAPRRLHGTTEIDLGFLTVSITVGI